MPEIPDINLRLFVIRPTARRETWNQFGRNVYNGRGGLVREKSQAGQDELFWFLTVMQNAIVWWNAMALEQANFIGTFFVINVTGCHISNDLPNRAS